MSVVVDSAVTTSEEITSDRKRTIGLACERLTDLENFISHDVLGSFLGAASKSSRKGHLLVKHSAQGGARVTGATAWSTGTLMAGDDWLEGRNEELFKKKWRQELAGTLFCSGLDHIFITIQLLLRWILLHRRLPWLPIVHH